MDTPTILILLLTLTWPWAEASAHRHQDFLGCLSHTFENSSSISNIVYTKSNTSYASILKYSIYNLRFASESTPKPQVIITPEHESHVPPLIHCAKEAGLEVRTRSGGHDFEGLSYASQVPFIIIDLINLSEITVDVEEKTAWVGAGATTGSLYYRIAEKSPILGFPAGGCLTIGAGGHFSGGGYGLLLRKYGLAADHVIDARIIDVNGNILDRELMGEDLFWAIRGGGAASFGVIVAWKIKLVDVPEKVTVCNIDRTLEQNATKLIHRWQYVAPNIDKDLFIGILIYRSNSSQQEKIPAIHASFFSLFLGGIDRLVSLMQEQFPELGLERENCIETSWIKSVLLIAGHPIDTPLQLMLNRTQPQVAFSKTKSNYVQNPIPEEGFEGIWRQFYEPEARAASIIMVPYGGRMAEISDSAIPFPHRAGNLYMLAHFNFWLENNVGNSDNYISWARRLYDYLTPYVSSNPRAAYLNYRDLDLGVNNVVGKTSYAHASAWGLKYFKNNFERLVRVKTTVDPRNFFRNEQSIPPMQSKGTN